MKESREATIFAQAILVWLMFAFGLLIFWLVCGATACFMLSDGILSSYHLFWTVVSATILTGGIFIKNLYCEVPDNSFQTYFRN